MISLASLSLGVSLTGCADKADEPQASEGRFSFFVTSVGALMDLSGSDTGFGGDLTFAGKPGVLGADELCSTIAERSLAGSGSQGWKAFLSTSSENAIDRIGSGPWFDRTGRKVADDTAGLVAQRPAGADPAIADDLPNEDGVPNHLDPNPSCDADGSCPDNHDVLTGSDQNGVLDPTSSTCDDWTNTMALGEPRIGHSWPAQSGRHWIFAHRAGGCEPGVKLVQGGAPKPGDRSVGAGGGYGGFYCFASQH